MSIESENAVMTDHGQDVVEIIEENGI